MAAGYSHLHVIETAVGRAAAGRKCGARVLQQQDRLARGEPRAPRGRVGLRREGEEGRRGEKTGQDERRTLSLNSYILFILFILSKSFLRPIPGSRNAATTSELRMLRQGSAAGLGRSADLFVR